MKKIRHYSDRPLCVSDIDFSLYRSLPDDPRAFFKPHGLWISIDDNSDGWRDWCLGEQFALDRLACVHEVVLSGLERILVLDSPQKLIEFTREYAHQDEAAYTYHKQIDWPRVQSTYQGIIIAPHMYSIVLGHDLYWYRVWDCASGCLWHPDAVKSITPISEVQVLPK